VPRNRNVPQRQSALSRQEDSIQTQNATLTVSFQSPLPPAELLAQYEHIHTGAIDIIIRWTEEESQHRRVLEEREQLRRHQIEMRAAIRSTRGLYFGFTIAVIGFGVALWLGLEGQEWVAGFISVADLATLAGVFVYGSGLRLKTTQINMEKDQ
jgi:uncharacterized membrane protein